MGQGAGQNSGVVSELDSVAGKSPFDTYRMNAELLNNQKLTSEQIAENKKKNLRDLGYMTPIIGNVMSAMDIPNNLYDVKSAVKSGNEQSQHESMANLLLSAIGAGSLPIIGSMSGTAGKAAKDSLNVFVPVEGGSTVSMASQLFNRGPSLRNLNRNSSDVNDELFRNLRMFFGPEGRLKREIPDQAAKLRKLRVYSPGDEVPLGEVLAHKKLFAERPDLARTPVEFTRARSNDGRPVARLSDDGETFEITAGVGSKWTSESLLKLLQYKIGGKAGFSPASRDSLNSRLKDIDDAIVNVTKGVEEGTISSDIASAYTSPLISLRHEVDAALTGDPLISKLLRDAGYSADRMPAKSDTRRAVNDFLFERLAGNREVAKVKARAREDNKKYPYAGDNIDEMIVLPPSDLRGFDLADFLAMWRGYGQGRMYNTR